MDPTKNVKGSQPAIGKSPVSWGNPLSIKNWPSWELGAGWRKGSKDPLLGPLAAYVGSTLVE